MTDELTAAFEKIDSLKKQIDKKDAKIKQFLDNQQKWTLKVAAWQRMKATIQSERDEFEMKYEKEKEEHLQSKKKLQSAVSDKDKMNEKYSQLQGTLSQNEDTLVVQFNDLQKDYDELEETVMQQRVAWNQTAQILNAELKEKNDLIKKLNAKIEEYKEKVLNLQVSAYSHNNSNNLSANNNHNGGMDFKRSKTSGPASNASNPRSDVDSVETYLAQMAEVSASERKFVDKASLQAYDAKKEEETHLMPSSADNIGAGSHLTCSNRRLQYHEDSVQMISGSNTKRGDLKIRVQCALQLKHPANYIAIAVGKAVLRTKKVNSDENPVWKEILTFTNFRPALGKTATVSVGNKTIMGDHTVGSVVFELPIAFKQPEKMTLDVRSDNHAITGSVVLEQCIVDMNN